MALFSVQQEKTTLHSIEAFAFKNHTVWPKKSSLPNGWTDTVYLFSFNTHIYVSNIGAQSLHIYVLTYTCITTNLWEPAFVHDLVKVLLKVKHVLPIN